jgi:hypothetical protein
MRHANARRLAGTAAAAGVLLVTVAGPALAAAGPVSAGFPDIEVPVGGTSVDPLGPSLWSTTGPMTLTGAKVTYELSGVAGVRITPSEIGGGDCVTPSSTRVICTDPRKLTFEGETIEQYLPVEVTAAKSAEPGSTGKVTITFSAKGVAAITGTSKVKVVGGLPVTGPRFGPAGLALLGMGAVGVFAARRRRARFVA